MAVQTVARQVGDTQVVLAVTITRPGGTAVDLTSLDVSFAMTLPNGTVKVVETEDNVAVTDASAGEVQYQFQDADVDTEGIFYAYFITVSSSGKRDTFPVERGDFRVNIMNEYWE